MNNDLISRSALLKKATSVVEYDEGGWDFEFKAVPVDDVMQAPAVDAVEVVRCKDCEHYINAYNDGFMYCMRPILSEDYNEIGYIFPLEVPMRETDFCSYGERRDDHE